MSCLHGNQTAVEFLENGQGSFLALCLLKTTSVAIQQLSLSEIHSCNKAVYCLTLNSFLVYVPQPIFSKIYTIS